MFSMNRLYWEIHCHKHAKNDFSWRTGIWSYQYSNCPLQPGFQIHSVLQVTHELVHAQYEFTVLEKQYWFSCQLHLGAFDMTYAWDGKIIHVLSSKAKSCSADSELEASLPKKNKRTKCSLQTHLTVIPYHHQYNFPLRDIQPESQICLFYITFQKWTSDVSLTSYTLRFSQFFSVCSKLKTFPDTTLLNSELRRDAALQLWLVVLRLKMQVQPPKD